MTKRKITLTKKELRCPECGSASIQTRLRDKVRVCRRCGYIGKYEMFEEEAQD